jgi:hypothetical protein
VFDTDCGLVDSYVAAVKSFGGSTINTISRIIVTLLVFPPHYKLPLLHDHCAVAGTLHTRFVGFPQFSHGGGGLLALTSFSALNPHSIH